MEFKRGDRVIYNSPDSRKIEGVIVDLEIDNNGWSTIEKALVKFDDPKLITNKMWVYFSLLQKTKNGPYINLTMENCECGLKFIKNGGDRHSTWCKAYKKPE